MGDARLLNRLPLGDKKKKKKKDFETMETPIAVKAVTNLPKLLGCHLLLIGESRMPGLCDQVPWRSRA